MTTPPRRVVEFSRAEFLATRWQLRPGEHCTILAPTDWGKTTLAYQLLEVAGTVQRPVVSLVKKPRDATVTKWAKRLDWKIVRTWPPMRSPWSPAKKPGYVLWPKYTFKPSQDAIHQYNEFQSAILESYRKGNRIVFADEVAGLVKLGLAPEIETVLQEGRAMGCSGFFATQRPANIPLAAYSQAAHLFLGNDPDERMIKRYSEIGGVDPKLIQAVCRTLQKYTWLYIKRHGRNGPELCVVGA